MQQKFLFVLFSFVTLTFFACGQLDHRAMKTAGGMSDDMRISKEAPSEDMWPSTQYIKNKWVAQSDK